VQTGPEPFVGMARGFLALDAICPSGLSQEGDPPRWVVEGLARRLRRRLGLQLFNFDLIKPDEGGLRCLEAPLSGRLLAWLCSLPNRDSMSYSAW
jgi:Inositol 1,3,4-trisphosphate 5/6-kinase ATP-grasp domain